MLQKTMIQNFLPAWERVVPGISKILSDINQKTTIGFGLVPYPRIVPSLFLSNYTVYAVKDTADLDLLRSHKNFRIFCLEERFAKAAAKIHAASYLLGNYAFHTFLKSRTKPFRLLVHRTTPAIVQKLEDLQIEWIGNKPETFQDVWLKTDFHALLKSLDLPHLGSLRIPREHFQKENFLSFSRTQTPPFTVQRVYSETGLEQNPFFITEQDDWEDMLFALSLQSNFSEVQVTPTLRGLSLFMAGCVTHKGVLTSSLQLQLVDVPEVLHGQPKAELLMGSDFTYCSWGNDIEAKGQHVVELVGKHLSKKGYRGLFGITFLYEEGTKKLLAIDCTPQYPEDLHIYSLGILSQKEVPPMDFFHLTELLGKKVEFDFKAVNSGLKKRASLSHIFLLREGIDHMSLPLSPGIYSFEESTKELSFLRKQAFPWELTSSKEFLMLDSMPRFNKPTIDNVPSLFKLIFPRSIGISSSETTKDVAALISTLSQSLRKKNG